jgi:exodeoxyribonuclease VII small subunit
MKDKDKDKDLNFEKALADLESIVEKLEKGGMSLSEALAHFEKGVKLARFLREELGKAEKKVEILLKDEKGEAKARAFSLDEGEDAEENEEEDEEEDGEDDAGKEADSKSKGRVPRGSRKKDDGGGLPF